MLIKVQIIIKGISEAQQAPESMKMFKHMYIKTLNTDSENEHFREDEFKVFCPEKILRHIEKVEPDMLADATLNIKGSIDKKRGGQYYRISASLVHIKVIGKN